jgi:hypothetical protein
MRAFLILLSTLSAHIGLRRNDQMPDKSALNLLDWSKATAQFKKRSNTSQRLVSLHDAQNYGAYAELAIGITDNIGNYSAAEHPKLRFYISENLNWKRRVYDLAGEFRKLKNAEGVRALITRANLDSLRIGVGSEISCMINPDVCWVCNIRTIWLHLAWTKSPSKAEQELAVYRIKPSESEMDYSRWAEEYHPVLGGTLTEVGAEGGRRVKAEGITVPKGNLYLWADAIATYAYDSFHV